MTQFATAIGFTIHVVHVDAFGVHERQYQHSPHKRAFSALRFGHSALGARRGFGS
jgi:hypothetical protein